MDEEPLGTIAQAVASVVEHRAAAARQLHADLVAAPGDDADPP